jgi:hypothetical protein
MEYDNCQIAGGVNASDRPLLEHGRQAARAPRAGSRRAPRGGRGTSHVHAGVERGHDRLLGVGESVEEAFGHGDLPPAGSPSSAPAVRSRSGSARQVTKSWTRGADTGGKLRKMRVVPTRPVKSAAVCRETVRKRSSCVFRESGLREGGELGLMTGPSSWVSNHRKERTRAWLTYAHGR